MKIEHYEFGKIKIEGREFTNDVIVLPDRVLPDWWRKEGHRLCIEDLKEVIDRAPYALVIGTGAHGVMNVPGEVMRELETRGIEPFVETTGNAVTRFNEMSGAGNVAGAFHLTC